jgi:alpha-beta hydrolase superfamily lysophospholipase
VIRFDGRIAQFIEGRTVGRYGGPAQVGVFKRAISDVQGNNDGIHGNERRAAGDTSDISWYERNPLTLRPSAMAVPGFSMRKLERSFDRFIDQIEEGQGESITRLSSKDIGRFEQFKLEKAIMLARFDRAPHEIEEKILPARGSVKGAPGPIEDRDLLVQIWKPAQGSMRSKRVAVVVPGFQESIRNTQEQIQLLTRQGHCVLALAPQWANKGGVDSGYGLARDIATVAAEAAELSKEMTGRSDSVFLCGHSMGAAGVALARSLNAEDRIQIVNADGRHLEMPKNLPVVLQAPYFERAKNVVNRALAAASRVPGLKDISFPVNGVIPPLTDDKTKQAKAAVHTVVGGMDAKLQAMTAPDDALRELSSAVPAGPTYVLHSRGDRLASFEAAARFAHAHGEDGQLHAFEDREHIQTENANQEPFLEAVRWAVAQLPPAS